MAPSPFLLLVEKTVCTYLEWLIGLYIADIMDTVNTSTPQALAIAAIPAALTVIAANMPQVGTNVPFYLGLLLNAVRTFAASFIGYMVALPFFSLDRSVLTAALVASLPTALALVKAGLATRVGNPTTPNLLPARLDPQNYDLVA
jgi:hypothetical protein